MKELLKLIILLIVVSPIMCFAGYLDYLLSAKDLAAFICLFTPFTWIAGIACILGFIKFDQKFV